MSSTSAHSFRKKLMALSKPKLLRMCNDYKLSKHGNKNDLMNRLIEYNESNGGNKILLQNSQSVKTKNEKKIKDKYMRNPKIEHEYVILYWMRNLSLKESNIRYNDIIYLITEFSSAIYCVLKWSRKYICRLNEELFLNDNDRLIIRKRVLERTYRWAMPNIEPVIDGIHCWRIKTLNPKKGWIAYCVSKREKFKSGTLKAYGHSSVHGIAYNKCWYSNGSDAIHNNVCLDLCQKGPFELDILLNLEKNILKFCIVGQIKKQTIFKNMPRYKEGYIPHFNFGFSAQKIALRIVEIPSQWFGFEKLIDYQERFI